MEALRNPPSNRRRGVPLQAASAAASMLATSIFTIVIIASKARFAFHGRNGFQGGQ
jgi:hypothetical protein